MYEIANQFDDGRALGSNLRIRGLKRTKKHDECCESELIRATFFEGECEYT